MLHARYKYSAKTKIIVYKLNYTRKLSLFEIQVRIPKWILNNSDKINYKIVLLEFLQFITCLISWMPNFLSSQSYMRFLILVFSILWCREFCIVDFFKSPQKLNESSALAYLMLPVSVYCKEEKKQSAERCLKVLSSWGFPECFYERNAGEKKCGKTTAIQYVCQDAGCWAGKRRPSRSVTEVSTKSPERNPFSKQLRPNCCPCVTTLDQRNDIFIAIFQRCKEI